MGAAPDYAPAHVATTHIKDAAPLRPPARRPGGGSDLPCKPCAGLRVADPAAVAGLLTAAKLPPKSTLFIAWEAPLDGSGDAAPTAAVAATGATPWVSLPFRTAAPLLAHEADLEKELEEASRLARQAPAGTVFQILWRPAAGEPAPGAAQAAAPSAAPPAAEPTGAETASELAGGGEAPAADRRRGRAEAPASSGANAAAAQYALPGQAGGGGGERRSSGRGWRAGRCPPTRPPCAPSTVRRSPLIWTSSPSPPPPTTRSTARSTSSLSSIRGGRW